MSGKGRTVMKTKETKRIVYGAVLTLICTLLFIATAFAAVYSANRDAAYSNAAYIEETE